MRNFRPMKILSLSEQVEVKRMESFEEKIL